MITFVRDALTRLPVETEADERQLNRIIERIATNVDAPSATRCVDYPARANCL
jgi:hypothetical protein